MTEPARGRIQFDPRLHTLQPDVEVPIALKQALAWGIAAELIRRNPAALRLREGSSHHNAPILEVLHRWSTPEGAVRAVAGLYWPGPWILTPDWYTAGGEPFTWLEALLADRSEYIVKQLEGAGGLTSPKATPPTTRTSIGPRLIAAFLERTSLSPTRWVASCGWVIEDVGDGPDEGLFEALPPLNAARAATHEAEQELRDSRYWFICPIKAGERQPPVAGIDVVDGIAWTPSRRTDLMPRYRELGSRIDALVSDVLPPAR